MKGTVTLKDFARSFGTDVGDIPAECRERIASIDFGYTMLEGKERDAVISEVLQKLESDTQIIGAQGRQDVWNSGWEENLRAFRQSGHNLGTLVPKFIRPNQAVRLNQNYVRPANPNFELDFLSVFRIWLFKKYFSRAHSVYEFGCGTGFNLVQLAQLYPDKKLYGLDFVDSSKELIDCIGKAYGWRMSGRVFDMTSPDDSLSLDPGAAVLTIGSIEQLASKFEPFLQFLLKNQPSICVHVEPTIELYDEKNYIDSLAIRFHAKRGYTRGFLPCLRELEAQGRIELLKAKRLYMGSLFMEGYTCIVWKPVKDK